MATLYMHTLEGQPAKFTGKQITFVGKRCANPFRESLKQIYDDRLASCEYRHRKGFKNDMRYGYLAITLAANVIKGETK